ncbi:MAG: acyl-CoA dehydrogenase family protein [Dehalococcoidia bacterium]
MERESQEEIDGFREQVRRFVERELAPYVDEWEEAGKLPREIYLQAGELGILGLGYPAEYGGVPASLAMRSVAIQEIARTGSGGLFVCLYTHSIFVAPVLALGTEEQKLSLVPPVLAGEKIGACGVTEPQGGSDVAGMSTRAVLDGDDYVIDGEKTFISNGVRADYYVVAARTGGPGAGGISLIFVDRNASGFTRTPLKKMGWWMSDTATLHFSGVRVPKSNRIGQEGQGFRTTMENFNAERLLMADEAASYSETCYAEALDWARQRRTFGKFLVEHQVIRHKLVDMKTRITSTRNWVESAIAKWDRGRRDDEFVAELCMLKNHAGQTMQWCADQAVQILGGMGFMRGAKSERIYRDAKAIMIGGGTEEILKELAARKLGL